MILYQKYYNMRKMKKTKEMKEAKEVKIMCKKLIITIFTALILMHTIVLEVLADVSGDLSEFFTTLGYDNNVTPGTAYQGQAAGYYSGGSVFLRDRVKN